MIHQVRVKYGERTLYCQMQPATSPKPQVVIHVNPDGTILIDAPAEMPRGELERTIAGKARWVLRQVDAARARRNGLTPRRYVSGETHYYLGRRYVLKRLRAEAAIPSVKLKHGQLQVQCEHATTDKVKALLGAWYRERAIDTFGRRLAGKRTSVGLMPWSRP